MSAEIVSLGGNPAPKGDAVGALHRTWIDIKAELTAGEKAVIEECERGEDAAVVAFQKALNVPLPVEVETRLTRHYKKVKAAHDQMSNVKRTMV